MFKWACLVCGLIYDETLGMPEHDIPAGPHQEDLPASRVCHGKAFGFARCPT